MRHSRFIRHAPLQPPLVGFIGRGATASIVVETAADCQCSSMVRHWHTVALQGSAVRACSLGGGQFKRLLPVGRAVTMGNFPAEACQWANAAQAARGLGRPGAQTRKSPARRIGTPIPVPGRIGNRGFSAQVDDFPSPIPGHLNRESGERELGISGSAGGGAPCPKLRWGRRLPARAPSRWLRVAIAGAARGPRPGHATAAAPAGAPGRTE
jgi:hypothetical protein